MTTTRVSTPLRRVVLFNAASRPDSLPADALALSYDEVKGWVRRGTFFRRLLHFQQAELRLDSLIAPPHPALAAWLLRLAVSRRMCVCG